jgi:hypothetical protein
MVARGIGGTDFKVSRAMLKLLLTVLKNVYLVIVGQIFGLIAYCVILPLFLVFVAPCLVLWNVWQRRRKRSISSN